MWPALLFQLFSPVDAAQLAALHEQRIEAAPAAEQRAAKRDLGLFWLRNARPDQAERWLREAAPGTDVGPFLAEAVAAQGRDAEPLFVECGRYNARCLTRLAQLAERRNDAAAALRHYQAAVAKEPTPPRRNDLGQALQAAGRVQEAEQQFRLALAEQRRQPNHPETATTQNNLASLLLAVDRLAEAEPLQRQALRTFERTLGPRHVRTGLTASNLADILRARGRLIEARRFYQQAVAVFTEALPPDHPWLREAREAAAEAGRAKP